MARPLRIEFPGAIYHVTSRGDRREAIYRDDGDRLAQLEVIAQAMDRFDAQVLAYCLMTNHYHLVLHTRQGNLSRLMRHVNGVYTQRYNQRHGLVGHLLQGRFKSILVDRDAYLLALCRYVERNPVAADMVQLAGDWPWSSYLAHVGQCATPAWLDSNGLHGYLLGRNVGNAQDQRLAARRYAALVTESRPGDATFWQDTLQGQVFLGDEHFAERMRQLAQPQRMSAREVPKQQRRWQGAWADCLAQCESDRNRALHHAYRDNGITMTQLASHTGLSVSHISRLIASVERLQMQAPREGK
jgi:putative transposase